jgi:hypothetical protein
MRALHAFALLQAAHAGVLYVPIVPEVAGGHDGVLPGMLLAYRSSPSRRQEQLLRPECDLSPVRMNTGVLRR